MPMHGIAGTGGARRHRIFGRGEGRGTRHWDREFSNGKINDRNN